MGGRALIKQGVETERVNATFYHGELVPSVEAVLSRALGPRVPFDVVPAYKNKPDFGDLDVVVGSDNLPDHWLSRIETEFAPTAMVKNGNVLSFDHLGVQIDLIAHPERITDFALRYHSYNDLGNLLGRVARHIGFKFGHAGLFYPLRDPDNSDHFLQDVEVTRDFNQALIYLGYSPDRFGAGFDDLEDVFAFVASGWYFDPAAFDLNRRSHRTRTRDAKRPSYRAFLDWLDVDADVEPAPVDQDAHLQRIRDLVPPFDRAMDQAIQDRDEQRLFRARFNGDVVREMTGLSGESLGRCVRAIVDLAGGKSAMRKAVVGMTEDEARSYIRRLCDQAAA